MSKRSILILAVIAMMAISTAAMAAPSYLGYTGLILTPTADTLMMSEFNLDGVFVSGDNNDVAYFAGNIGLFKGLEVGAAVIDPDEGDSNTIINTKFRLLPETVTQPAIAVGVSDITDELDVTPYLVVSKLLPINSPAITMPRIHVGVGSSDFVLDGFFAGFSMGIAQRTQFMAEYDSSNVNFGLTYALSNEFRGRVDLLDGDNFGFGLSFNKSL